MRINQRLLRPCGCLCAITSFVLVGINEAWSAPDDVTVGQVVKVMIGKDQPAYLASYEYDFPGISHVRIPGFGVVPGKGNFEYLVRGTELEFQDPTNGVVLLRKTLYEKAIVAATPPLTEVPDESLFPLAFQTYYSAASHALPAAANVVLRKYFRYLPHESEKKTYLVTTFTPLDDSNLPPTIRSKVALLLSFPYDIHEDKCSFHVQSLVYEGRSHSKDFRLTTNELIVKNANAFIEKLAAEMKQMSENPKP